MIPTRIAAHALRTLLGAARFLAFCLLRAVARRSDRGLGQGGHQPLENLVSNRSLIEHGVNLAAS